MDEPKEKGWDDLATEAMVYLERALTEAEADRAFLIRQFYERVFRAEKRVWKEP